MTEKIAYIPETHNVFIYDFKKLNKENWSDSYRSHLRYQKFKKAFKSKEVSCVCNDRLQIILVIKPRRNTILEAIEEVFTNQ